MAFNRACLSPRQNRATIRHYLHNISTEYGITTTYEITVDYWVTMTGLNYLLTNGNSSWSYPAKGYHVNEGNQSGLAWTTERSSPWYRAEVTEWR